MDNKKIVISLGGSLLSDDFTYQHIAEYVTVFEKLYDEGYSLTVTVGGGRSARKYIDILSQKQMKEKKEKHIKCDMIAVSVTHSNALLLKYMTDDKKTYPKIPKSNFAIKTAIKTQQKTNNIIYCGGTKPFQSTDGVASFCALNSGAELIINATNIDGVYDKNPKEDSNAKKIDKLSYEEFRKIIAPNPQSPGKYALFDLKAIPLLENQKIKLVILDGRDPQNILKAVKGNKSGSLIS
ncbi:MAG: UMP kinase [Candidatus Aenigmarchaeota archaeon]|nr:UMP kinase [Candidatus Aenigmarchaeota archaeon]